VRSCKEWTQRVRHMVHTDIDIGIGYSGVDRWASIKNRLAGKSQYNQWPNSITYALYIYLELNYTYILQ